MDSLQSIKIAPSLLSADFANLEKEIQKLSGGGADWIHLDIMDGHFVPNLTFGPSVVKALRPLTSLPFDCHLMVSRPEDWIDEFVKAGANWITIHAETTSHLDRMIQQIQQAGCKAGVSINPATSLSLIEEVLDCVDLVLVMSVNPGFGGQKFIPYTLSKIQKLKKLRNKNKFLIEVDGGVDLSNIQILHEVGADVAVAGSAVFKGGHPEKAIQELKNKSIINKI